MRFARTLVPAAIAALFLSSGPGPAQAAADGDGARAGETCAGHPGTVRLLVDVQGVRSSQGLIAVTLYADNPQKFLAHHGSLYVGRVPARQGTTRLCLWVPKPGIWALAVYHDENGNRKFDRNMFGMPREGAGFSNNPSTFFGLPAFHKVRFQVRGPETGINVRLKYP
ncbi:MAG TPA: DUF2141 domain-containing protein [Allosphingosinicella sp.]|nr:DUF2141 domain-containing protein [Allosphingosinicella sp.]